MGPSPSDTSLPVQKSKGKKGVLAAAIPDDPASPNWSGVKSLALARPLFDALPELLAVVRSGVSDKDDGTVAPETVRPVTDVVAAAEYALWLTMDVLAALLQRLSLEPGSEKGRAKRLYDGRLAGEDAERVLSCMKENPSPQTRLVFVLIFRSPISRHQQPWPEFYRFFVKFVGVLLLLLAFGV